MKYRIIIKEANGTTKAEAPEKTWNPLETEPVPEPTWSGASKFASESEGFNIEDAIAKQYGLKIVKNISVGKTAFSNVYLVEPQNIRLFGNQKEVVLKLSKNENEYLPYERINKIRRNMIKSKDLRDKQAANYLPFIYLAKKIDIAQYGSIIVMEKLKEVPVEIIERLSYSPWNNASTLIELLKDEDFIIKLFNTSFQKLPKTSALLNKNENWLEKTKSIKDKIVYDIITGKKTNFNISKKLLNELDDVVKFEFKTPTRSGQWDVKVYYKQVNDIDLAKKEIFRIIKIITYHFINGISSSPLTDILIKNFIEIMINELKTGVPVAPVSAYYPSKTNVDISTYKTLGPATQNFEDALARLEKYGLERKDLHGKNYLMRDNGQIVISDPGLFVIK